MELQKISQGLPVTGIKTAYRGDIESFNNWLDGRTTCQDTILEYFDSIKADGMKPATIQKKKAAIKSALLSTRGQELNLMEKATIDGFFREIKSGSREMSVDKEDVLTEDELQDLLRVSGKKTALIIRALYETACRVSELCNIKLTDCEIKKGAVVIRTVGKGSKEGKFFISLDLYNDIRAAYINDKWLFGNGKKLSRLTVYTMVKRAGHKIGRPDISPHTLRHTWATLSIKTLGLAKVSGYLRHSNTSTTAKFYLHGKADISEIMAVNTLKLTN